MAVVSSRISVVDTAGGTALHTGDAGPSGTRLTVTNRDGTNSVSLGPSGVTFAAGYELKKAETVSLTLSSGDALYAIASSAITVVVHVLKTGE